MQILDHPARLSKLRLVQCLIVSLWSAVICFANAGAPPLPVIPDSAVSHRLITPWAITDLDGDHLPDLANSTPAGMDAKGFRYRVDFQLGSGLQVGAFTVSTSNRLGLNIVPRDVDGDHDLDLIITSGASREPVGIWLNDGQGGFSQADASRYPAEDRAEELQRLQQAGAPSCALAANGGQRPCFAVASAPIHGRPANRDTRIAFLKTTAIQFTHALSNLTRGPPFPLLF